MKQMKVMTVFLAAAIFCGVWLYSGQADPVKKNIVNVNCKLESLHVHLKHLEKVFKCLEDFNFRFEFNWPGLEAKLKDLEIRLEGMEALECLRDLEIDTSGLENFTLKMKGLEALKNLKIEVKGLEALKMLEDFDFDFSCRKKEKTVPDESTGKPNTKKKS